MKRLKEIRERRADGQEPIQPRTGYQENVPGMKKQERHRGNAVRVVVSASLLRRDWMMW